MALETLELDGSIGEGGGQVLRVAVALSAIISKPLHIFNIRKRRGNPGLRPQHIAAVKLVAEACRAEVRGLAVGSGELFFKPRRLAGGDFSLDTGTAGSITLILQSLLPVLSLGDRPSSFRLVGGTNNPMAPPIEYIEGVLLPVLERMGVDCEIELVRRGFYPRGGGVVRGVVRPSSVLHPIKMRGRTNIKRVDGLSYTCKLPQHISERMAATAEKLLYQNGLEAHLVREALTSQSPKCSLDPGAGLILTAVGADVAIGADRLGEVGVPAERVASE
ncbi:MAG: RNA 3'-terminal phosphate cyclase, partial [Nitrososphaerota archaeon]